MDLINFFKYGPKTEENCPICLENIREKTKHILPCNHILHKECFISYTQSRCPKNCPTCRAPIQQNINQTIPTSKCSICLKNITINEETCDIVRSFDCGCYFHYLCIKSSPIQCKVMNTIKCNNCKGNIFAHNIEGLSYLYFREGYEKWVGKIVNCKVSCCTNKCNPKRFGYCLEHTNRIARNTSFSLCLKYFVKYINELDESKRREMFNKLLIFIDSTYPEGAYYDIDFYELRLNVLREKVL